MSEQAEATPSTHAMDPRLSEVIVFDGTCLFCAASVNFILRHERTSDLLFTPLQSAAGARLLRQYGFDPDDARTFVLVSNGTAYTKSTAAIRVCAHLRGAWKWLAAVRIVPRPLRDWVYDLFARNRYRWFGRSESCLLPTPELAERILVE